MSTTPGEEKHTPSSETESPAKEGNTRGPTPKLESLSLAICFFQRVSYALFKGSGIKAFHIVVTTRSGPGIHNDELQSIRLRKMSAQGFIGTFTIYRSPFILAMNTRQVEHIPKRTMMTSVQALLERRIISST